MIVDEILKIIIPTLLVLFGFAIEGIILVTGGSLDGCGFSLSGVSGDQSFASGLDKFLDLIGSHFEILFHDFKFFLQASNLGLLSDNLVVSNFSVVNSFCLQLGQLCLLFNQFHSLGIVVVYRSGVVVPHSGNAGPEFVFQRGGGSGQTLLLL